MNDSLTVLYLSDDEIETIQEALEVFYNHSTIEHHNREYITDLVSKIHSHQRAKGQSGGGTGPY